MQKLFPPLSEAATAGSASPDVSTAQPSAAETSEPAAVPVRPFAWPPPEEDLDDWHVFQFGDEAAATAPSAPTVKLKPSEAPTLKLVSSQGEPVKPAGPAVEVEAPLAHLPLPDKNDLADTAELGSANAPVIFMTPDTAPLATPKFTTPPTAPILAPAPSTPKFELPATGPMIAPVEFTTGDTGPIAAPAFTTPITAPLPAPTPVATPPRPLNSAITLGLSRTLTETSTSLPVKRTPTPPPVPTTADPPLMSTTVEVITRSAQAQQQTAARAAGTPASWAWVRRLIIIALALLAVGEAAYIATLRLRAPAATPATGALFVQSQPAGADLLVDGQLRGKTPLRLELSPGQHVLQLRKDGVTRRLPFVLAAGTEVSQYVEMRTSDVEPAATPAATPAAEAPAATTPAATLQPPPVVPTPAPVAPPKPAVGWLIVQSSVQLNILRNGESIGNSDDGRLAIGPGNQELELSNDAAGYREATTIRILPGQITTLRPDLPQSTVDIESTPTAKVSIDGRAIGQTPLAQIALTIGSHDILFTHPDFPERHVSTFIKVGTPAHVAIDLATP